MVGTGGAGKTTVVRQLKCLCTEMPKEYKVRDYQDKEQTFRHLIRHGE